MATFDIFDIEGKKSGSCELSDAVFGVEPNIPVMHLAVRAQRNSWRQGTSSTKTRSMVSGGGRKPWRQKGTGRARQGTIRAPQWRGGGVVFGPHPRDYDIKINAREVKLALRSAFSAKLADDELIVVDDFDFAAPRTKDAVKAMGALGIKDAKVTLVIPDNDINTYKSFRNIPRVRVIGASDINVYDLLDNEKLVLTSSAVKHAEEVLA